MKLFWNCNIVIILFILISASSVLADDSDYEKAAYLRKSIDGLTNEINEAETAVGKTLTDMGSTPEARKAFHSAVNRYGQIAAKNTRQIGNYVEQLVAIDPNASLPTLRVSSYEEQVNRTIAEIESNQRELDKIMTSLLEAHHVLSDMLAMAEKAQDETQFVEAFRTGHGVLAKRVFTTGVTTGITMATGYTMPMVGAAMVAAAPVAGTVVVAGVVVVVAYGVYNDVRNIYNAVMGDGPATLLIEKRRIKYQDDLIKVMHEYNLLKPVAANLDALAQEFKVDSDKFRPAREEIEKITAAWKGLVDASKKKKAEEQIQAIQKQLSAPRAPIPVSQAGTQPPPIAPSEYMEEAKAMLAEMESAVKAAMDGGDPDYFGDVAARRGEALRNRYQAARKNYDAKTKAQEQMYYTQYWPRQNQIYEAYWACDNALYNRSWRPPEGFWAASQACVNALSTASQANEAQMEPYRLAVREANRELIRLYQLHNAVGEGFGTLKWMLSQYAYTTSTEYNNVFQQKSTQLWEASKESSELLSQLPHPSSFIYWREAAERLDRDVASRFDWGESPVTVRDSLLLTAATLRGVQDNIKKTLPKYRSALEAHRQEANSATKLVTSMLNKDALLIISTWDGTLDNISFPAVWSSAPPWHRDGDRRKEMIAEMEKRITSSFKIYEPDYLKQLENANLEAIAVKYDAKAKEIDYIVEQIEFYRGRKGMAAFRLDKISMEQTKSGLYDNRPKTAVDTALESLTRNEWEALTARIDDLKSIADGGPAMPWDRTPWDKKTPRDRLLRITGALYENARTVLKNYIQMKQYGYGGFAYASDNAKLNQLNVDWQKVRPLLSTFDEKAAPVSAKIGNTLEVIEASLPPVSKTYSALPGIGQNTVAVEHRTFNQVVSWLNEYLSVRKGALLPMADPKYNNVVPSIDEWLASYPKDRDRFIEMQRKAQEDIERQRRAWEAEQAKIKAEQEQRIQEEQRKTESGLAAVTALYNQFKQAYEARNDSQVISFMGDQWEAGDGTTLSDLQANLSRSFRTFDDIKYTVQNLAIKLNQEGRYSVSYDVTITSRIFRRNLKHEEKSSISEEVTVDSSGKAKISKTLGGRFWYVQ